MSPAKIHPVAAIDAIRALARDAHNTSIKSGNYIGHLSLGDQILGVVRALGVASNYVRRSKNLREISTDPHGKPIGFGVLIANAVITLFDISEHAGVDLGAALLAKMQWNKQQTIKRGNE